MNNMDKRISNTLTEIRFSSEFHFLLTTVLGLHWMSWYKWDGAGFLRLYVRSIISSLKLGDYLSVQAQKPYSIYHLEQSKIDVSNVNRSSNLKSVTTPCSTPVISVWCGTHRCPETTNAKIRNDQGWGCSGLIRNSWFESHRNCSWDSISSL